MITPRRVAGVFSIGVIAFLLLPLVVVIPVSFTSSSSLGFPPDGFSLRWYEELVGDPRWAKTALYSARIGVVAALVATTVGFLAAYAMRSLLGPRNRSRVLTLALLPFVVPTVIGALAIFKLADVLGLRGSFWALALGHTILVLPFSVVLIDAALQRLNPDLMLAARSLGAGVPYAARRILLPVLAPSLVGSAIFAFIMSWDEVIMALLVGDVRNRTLPVLMFEFLLTRIEPTVAALSSVLIAAGFVLVVLQEAFIALRKKRRGSVM